MEIKTSIVIDAPIEKVFRTFCDLEGAEENISGISKIEILKGSSQIEVGTRWRETRVMMGKEATEEMEISKFEKNKMYEAEAHSNGTDYRTTFNFKSLDSNKTEVEMIFGAKAVSFLSKIMMPLGYLFSGAMKKMLHKDLADLKKAIEN